MENFNVKLIKKDKIPLKLCDLKSCDIFYATEEDLINPIAYFETLWNVNKPAAVTGGGNWRRQTSTGIIKIIPPESFQKRQKQNFENNYKERLQDKDKKLCTRKQNLNSLYMAKVILISKIFIFFYACLWHFMIVSQILLISITKISKKQFLIGWQILLNWKNILNSSCL